MEKKVTVSPRVKTGRFWQTSIDPEHAHLKDSYAFLSKNQTLRPVFNTVTYRFELGPISDRYSDEKINTLVKKLGFSDPQTGAKIIESDPSNRKDPFFNHLMCKAKLGREIQVLDLRSPQDELIYAILSADPLCVIGKTAIAMNPVAEWIIEDEEVDAISKESKRDRSIKLHTAYDKLSPSQKRNLYTALGGRKLSGTEKDSIVDGWLFEKITENKSNEDLVAIQNLFFELVDPENKGKLDVTVLVEELYHYGILRKENINVFFNGEQLNTDTINVIDFLRKPENSGLFLTLEEALNAKKKTN